MDIQIRTGKNLACEYSGEDVSALVRVKADDENDWSAWMGRPALEQAMRMLAVAEGSAIPAVKPPPGYAPITQEQLTSPPSPVPQQVVATETPVDPNRPAAPPYVKPGNDPALVKNFVKAAERLANSASDEPSSPQSKHAGVTEADIRKLVFQYRDSFHNPLGAMYTTMRSLFGMERPRLEFLLKAKDAETLSERGEDEA